ncbi:MAG: lipopolysaccharide biosynthesis protein [Muribaculaceae bacterium]|nr:lipopolysaccharide biosynthesis protein [Muribaculaceae bacterium]
MKLIYYIWAFLERFGGSMVSLVGNIILSYLLLPEHFGLVAMIGIFTSLVFALVDCGLSDGVLMYKNPSDRDFNTIFFFNITMGIALFLVFWAISPLVARFFGHPELQKIMTVMGIGAIFSGLNISQTARIRSQLKFKKLAAINIISTLLAVITAIVMALCGMRYWALVGLNVGYSAFFFICLVVSSKWGLKFEFDVERFKKFWKFGVNLLFSYLVTQLSQNIFAFILGKFYNSSQAGFMGQAQKLQQTPVNSLENSISVTSYVLIAKEKSNEDKYEKVRMMFGIYTFVNAIVCAGLFALSYPLISFVFPEKWLPVIPYFRLMLVWALIYPVCSHMMIIFKLFNKTSVIRNILTIEKTGIIVLALLLYPLGVEAIILGATLISTVAFLLSCHFAKRLTQIPISFFIMTLLKNIGFSFGIAAITYLAITWIPGSALALFVGVAVFCCATVVSTKLFRKEYYEMAKSRIIAKDTSAEA